MNQRRSTIKKKLSDLQTLIDISKQIITQKDLNSLLSYIADKIRESIRVDRTSLYLIDKETNELWTQIAQDLEIKEIRMPIGKGLAGYVAKTGKLINIPDAYKDKRFNKHADKKTGYKTKTVLCAPLINHENQIIGVIQLLNKSEGVFDEYDESLVMAFAAQAAISIENAQLYAQKEKTFQSLLKTMATTLDARDPVAAGHSERVAKYALNIGRALEFSENELKALEYAALLHDIGKIGIRDNILLKPGKLTDEEYAIMRQHVDKTGEILKQIYFADYLHNVPEIATNHHERLDGKGYPLGLKDNDLSVASKILAIADVYDALISYDRPYKRAMTVDEALAVLNEGKNTAFDPQLVELFINKRLYKIERRIFERINCNLSIEYEVTTADAIKKKFKKNTQTINVSGAGLQFNSSIFIPMNSFVDIFINLPQKTINVCGKIVRVTKTDSDQYNVGIKFINLGREIMKKLELYLTEAFKNDKN